MFLILIINIQSYNIEMKSAEEEFNELQGELQKLSTSILIGYQAKFWKILENGTKIGYRNLKQQSFQEDRIFDIKNVHVQEGMDEVTFELVTPHRTFLLKAINSQQKKKWVKAIGHLRKALTKRSKTSKVKPLTEKTPSLNQSTQHKTRKTNTTNMMSSLELPPKSIAERRKTVILSKVAEQFGINRMFFQELSKQFPEKILKYHTLLINLKRKNTGLFNDKLIADTYMFISPKSLYPEVHISDENLTNKQIPPWAELNTLYCLTYTDRVVKKKVFEITKILQIRKGEGCNIKLDMGEVVLDYFCRSKQETEVFLNRLQVGKDNAKEVLINGKVVKKNYDKLIFLYKSNHDSFKNECQSLLDKFLPSSETHKYEPEFLVNFLAPLPDFLTQFITIVEHKKNQTQTVINELISFFHEQVKISIKLTWDSSREAVKGIDILQILKSISQYYDAIKQFLKSLELQEGMKELSKIYIRTSWKNFESIILKIAEQEKFMNLLEDDQSSFIETNGVIDLFKFIYDVFELAAPHWRNNLHLRNVSKLMLRALEVYVNQMKAMIDEEFIEDKQLVGLANNYFRFSELVDSFYEEKFSEVDGLTDVPYLQVKKDYREVSMIILDKFATKTDQKLKQYCESRTFSNLKIHLIFDIITSSTQLIHPLLHIAFQKKIFQKIGSFLRVHILQSLARQVQTYKKNKEILFKRIEQFTGGIVEGFRELQKSHHKLQQELKQINTIIFSDLLSDIEEAFLANPKKIQELYKRIIKIRADYGKNSWIQKLFDNLQLKKLQKINQAVKGKRQSTKIQQIKKDHEEKNGFIEEQDKRIQNSLMISQGYMSKGKVNMKIWQKQYFRLRNGYLYIFQSDSSQQCRNKLKIQDCQQILVREEKPAFIYKYKKLGKNKELKFKCENMEIRDRWVHSIEQERKRIINEIKVQRKRVQIYDSGRKKNQLIIDYEELDNGRGYFSYV